MSDNNEKVNETKAPSNFIRNIIEQDVKNGKNDGEVITRFPPEPNGYLHIGHAKSICLNFGIARDYETRCHLRFDDTNPEKEDTEYVDSIKEDISWLGFKWGEHEYFASDYYQKLYDYAVQLVKDGKAFVCSLNADEVREYRGNLKTPGKNSPDRDRPVEENLELLEKMKAGEFDEGQYTLRAKIDMASPNMNMRDPAIYRIRKATHHRTGDDWCIYPMYDFAHGLSDAIEGITHSLCSLEFEDHRPLYDWFLDNLPIKRHPQQIEFARLNLNYTVMSKRKLRQLVEENHVDGWNDPRMPTLSGLRRRGYTPESIVDFCERIGVAKAYSTVDIGILEHCIREDLNKKAPRFMAVLDPLKVVIENFPEDKVEELQAVNNPEDESAGKRIVPFSRELYIERSDFMEDAPKKFFRLAPGKEVRLRWAYFLKCNEVIKDENGEIIELRCTYDPETKGGKAPDGRKVKGTIHWVSAKHAFNSEVRLYDRLFLEENPEGAKTEGGFLDCINPDSLKILPNCKLEPSLAGSENGFTCQFERTGYFAVDSKYSEEGKPVFNRVVPLKDTWAKIQKRG
jgi:glutaminyl-tRNA synthetase